MVLRLVNDVVWRQRWAYLTMAPIMLVTWFAVGSREFSLSTGFAFSLMLSYALGPMAAIATTNLRELRVLPVTSRELWLTTWTVSVVVGSLFLLVTQLLAATTMQAIGGESAVTAEVIVLTALYGFVYAGALLPLGPLMGYSAGYIGIRKPQWLWIAISTIVFLLYMGGIGFPWLFAPFLPVSFDQFSLLSFTPLAGCLMLTAVSWSWTPLRGGVARANPTVHFESAGNAQTANRIADRFTGLARIYVAHVALTLVTSVLIVAGFVGYWVSMNPLYWLVAFLQTCGLLPFMVAAPVSHNGFGDGVMLFGFMLIAATGAWNPLARQLKVLPLTVGAINRLFVLTPLLTWALVWLVLVALHFATIGTPPETLRLDVFIFAAGATATGHALALRFKPGGRGFPWFFAVLGLATSILTRAIGTTPSTRQILALVIGGLMAFAIAAIVNHRTLTRSTSSARVFQPDTLPFGMGPQGAQR